MSEPRECERSLLCPILPSHPLLTPFSVEHELFRQSKGLSDRRSRLVVELAEKRELLGEVEGRAEELAAEDKALDRNFKKVCGGGGGSGAQKEWQCPAAPGGCSLCRAGRRGNKCGGDHPLEPPPLSLLAARLELSSIAALSPRSSGRSIAALTLSPQEFIDSEIFYSKLLHLYRYRVAKV